MWPRIAGFLVIASVLCAAASAQTKPAWADPAKTLRVAFPVAETGFDPQATSDLYSNHVQRAIFDTLYVFDYLARPYKLAPSAAAAMPEIADGGRTWTIRVRPGVFFTDDPAFKGKKRELTAADFVYSWKRLIDPRMRSPFAWILERKLVGVDALIDAARTSGNFDYDAPLEGLQTIDAYTIRIKLKEPDYILRSYLSHGAMAAVAREVVEAYGDESGWVMAHPVGTGPYVLKEWRRGQRIVLEANPGYREDYFPSSGEPGDRELIAQMKGKRLPQIGRIEVAIIEESNPRLLSFNAGELDYVNGPSDLVDTVLNTENNLRPEYAQRGVTLTRATLPSLNYMYFNMEDPIVGGYSKDRIALRRAIVIGFDTPALIRTIYKGQAYPATQPIPPNLPGHDDAWNIRLDYDPAAAKALLDRFGYVDRNGDGWRDRPDGKPLLLMMASATSERDRQFDELWQRSMAALGIRIEFTHQKFPDLLKMGRVGKLQMMRIGWITNYGEGDAFAQLLYSANIGQSNYARFSLPEYDALYRKSRTLPDGAERNALYRKMSELVAAYNPWELGIYTVENTLVAPWVRGYKKHIYQEHAWKYYDVDVDIAARARTKR